MATPNRARAKLACEIAGIDPNRFNEAVFAGNYRCAPETAPGKARIFDMKDLLALCVYGQKLEQEVPARRAGGIACGVREVLTENPDCRAVLHIRADLGSDRFFAVEQFDRAAEKLDGLTILEIHEYRLDPLRARIKAHLEDAAGIVGEE